MAADPDLIASWLTARSICRGLPIPVAEHGGLRVDTNSETEVRRWVFPAVNDGLEALGSMISQPRHFLKLCDDVEVLAGILPEHWTMQPLSYVMTLNAGSQIDGASSLPEGYRMTVDRDGPTTRAMILDRHNMLAARGYATEAAGVFVYDRIVTEAAHRRRGLGRAVMSALGTVRQSSSAPQILVATEEGKHLYTSLGWRIHAPYATAAVAETA